MKKILNFLADNFILFIIYSFIGWLYEVSWFLIFKHKFVNRGVLFGPLLPIYGFGILILLLLLNKFKNKKHYSSNIIYTSISVFTIVTFIITTIIEYTTDKITNVMYYLNHYGLILLVSNLIAILIVNILIQKNDRLKNKDMTIFLVFLGIWIITTLLEFISHYFIETYSHKLLWDYSKDFLNINKRVNWDASRNFAIGGVVALYIIQPILYKLLDKIKFKNKMIIVIGNGLKLY